MLRAEEFFDLSHWDHPALFPKNEPVWQVIQHIKPYLAQSLKGNVRELLPYGPVLQQTLVLHQRRLLSRGFDLIPGDATKGEHRVIEDGNELPGATVFYAGACLLGEDIFVGAGSVVEPGALIKGPTVIGEQCEIRQGAYIRGYCLVGDRCVVGHTTEMKQAVMLDEAKAGHFAYIGDSILGNRTNLGAGTKLANLKLASTPVVLKVKDKIYQTGLRKFGAVIGDDTEIGCNTVTNPGTLLGRRCLVYPGVSVKSGYYKQGTVVR